MGKNSLVFMDGTRNKPSDQRILKDTNVWKPYDAAARGRGKRTIAKYVRGIGTRRDDRGPPERVEASLRIGVDRSYVIYPYERDLAWTKYLPGSDTYPGNVAGALSFVDDHVVRMHLSRGGSGSTIRLVTELRLLDEYLAGVVLSLSRSPLDANKLFDALSLLGAFGHTQGIDRFVKAAARRAGRLTRLADRSGSDGLAIREKWLPRFIEIGEVLARWHTAAGPDLADFAQDAHAQVRDATQALRANLPYLAPFKAAFDKDKVRRRQQDLQG